MNMSDDTESTASETAGSRAAASESERIAQAIHEAVDRFAEHAAEAEQRIREAAGDARGRWRDGRRAARRGIDRGEHAVEDYIDHHPWYSLGIAFGAGMVISSLLRR